MTPEIEAEWLCQQCGPKTKVDEDGCCKFCGSDAFLSTAEWFVAFRRAERIAALQWAWNNSLHDMNEELDRLKREGQFNG